MNNHWTDAVVKIRPFQPNIGQRLALNSPAASSAMTWVEQLLAKWGTVRLLPSGLTLQWLQAPGQSQQTVHQWQTWQTAVTHYHHAHHQWLTPITVRLNQLSQRFFKQTHTLQTRLATAVSHHSHAPSHHHAHRQQTTQLWHINQPQAQQLHLQFEKQTTHQTVNTHLVERIFQQGRRVEPNGQPPSAKPTSPQLEQHFLHAVRHEGGFHHTQKRVIREKVVPVAQETVGGKNGRFSPTPNTQPTTPLTNIDGTQLQQLTDKIVQQIDQKIIAQRERMGKY